MCDDPRPDPYSEDAAVPETVNEALPPEASEADVALVHPAPASEVIDTGFFPPLVGWPVEAAAIPDRDDSGTRLAALEHRVESLIETLGQRFDALQALFEREVRAESTREKVVDRLHAELQEYKQDLLLSMMRPVFIDLIQLHDDIGKMIDAATGDEPIDPLRLRQILEGIQQGLEDVLDRQGVEPFAADGPGFDPRKQRAVATVATDLPERNKLIAARLRKGFQAGERVIRPEIVSVFAYKTSD